MSSNNRGSGERRGGEDRRAIATEFFQMVGSGRFKEGLRFFAPDCRQHNPYIQGSMDVLTDAMSAASKEMAPKFPDGEFRVEHILSDGDMVAVHTNLLGSRSKPGEGGLRQVHLFRFEGDKIVEYWDITQQLSKDMPNAAGAF
jgi:predicted SnoaL-like aldol condensation-catalyzing enzyme